MTMNTKTIFNIFNHLKRGIHFIAHNARATSQFHVRTSKYSDNTKLKLWLLAESVFKDNQQQSIKGISFVTDERGYTPWILSKADISLSVTNTKTSEEIVKTLNGSQLSFKLHGKDNTPLNCVKLKTHFQLIDNQNTALTTDNVEIGTHENRMNEHINVTVSELPGTLNISQTLCPNNWRIGDREWQVYLVHQQRHQKDLITHAYTSFICNKEGNPLMDVGKNELAFPYARLAISANPVTSGGIASGEEHFMATTILKPATSLFFKSKIRNYNAKVMTNHEDDKMKVLTSLSAFPYGIY